MKKLTESPVITTVIPTFRRSKLVQRAVLSVLNQTYPHVLACVYDNASGDETESVVKGMMAKDPRIRYYRHPENIGSYPNFNFGISRVDTPFFSLLSDDDILAPDFYEKALNGFELHPEAGMACLPTLVVNTQLNVITRPINIPAIKLYRPGEAVQEMIEARLPATWTAILFRTIVRDTIGLVDLNVGPQADGGYVYYAAAKFPVVTVPGVGAVLMAHDATTSGTVPPIGIHYARWWNAMFQKITDDEDVPSFARTLLRNPPHHDYRSIGIAQVFRSLVSGNYRYASEAASGVVECGYPVTGRLLGFITRCCKIFPLRRLFLVFRGARLFVNSLRRKALQRRYGNLINFIQQYRQD